MNWREHDRTTWVSDDGRYSIARVTYVTAKGPEPRYEAWKRRAHPDGPGRITGTWIARHEAETAVEAFDAT